MDWLNDNVWLFWLGVAFVLAAIGGALGLMFAYWATRLFVRIGGDSIPRPDAIAIDGRVMLFTLAIAVVLAKNGIFSTAMALPSALAMAAAATGMVFGQWARARVSVETFRRWFFAGMLVLGAHLALRVLW